MCKLKRQLMVMALVMAIGGIAMGDDVTAPGDPVIGQPNDGRWPGGEAPMYAIDNDVETKYLHFDYRADNIPGIIITPARGATVVQGVRFASANDSPDRDPLTYTLEGSASGVGGPWTLINAGSIPDFAAGWDRLKWTVTPMVFPNSNSYTNYRLMFPTINGAGMFQVAEIELLEKPVNGWPAAVSVDPAVTVITLPENTLVFNATVDDFDSTSWTFSWSQVSGPATVDFGDTQAQEDATVVFPAVKGTYTLVLDVTDDGGNPSTPQKITVRVWDKASDEKLIGHWAFDEAEGTKVANDLALDNDRGYLGNYQSLHHDPNFVPGWVTLPGATANNALDFTDAGFVEVYPDPNSVVDPNLMNLDFGVSLAGWVYGYDWTGNRRIAQFGNPSGSDEANIFRMLREGNGMRFVASSQTTRELTVTMFPANEWHHVAGTYDGKAINIYIDGVLAGTKEFATYAPLYPYESQVLTVGAKNRNVNYVDYPGDYMYGKLDDLRVYSYPINLETVRSLVQLGQNSAPAIIGITAPEEFVLTGSATINVNAEIYDAHGDTITYSWEQISPISPVAEFSAINVEDPQVTFAEPGTYIFRLTINDGVYGLEGNIFKTVTIQVNEADCAQVKADGLLMASDINEDCRVNLDDFALIALDWLKCNDPQDPDCDNPYMTE
ncbi:MAG: LamG domain-containing protein [Sedimentisphaerales bacterium]|nr:LamG domain-containing protein [Sedimentisphaerales bacterium]